MNYHPIPESIVDKSLKISYIDGWMVERNYKGKRGHEGTDVMANVDKRGIYPVLSMTDGVITNLGWLEKGGYRVGITSNSGIYYYYAHLDSYANITEGQNFWAIWEILDTDQKGRKVSSRSTSMWESIPSGMDRRLA